MTVASAAESTTTPKGGSPNLKISESAVEVPALASLSPIVITAIKIRAGIDRIDRRHTELIADRKDIRAKLEQQGKKLNPTTCVAYTKTELELVRLKGERTAFDKLLSETLEALFCKQGQLFSGVECVICAVTGQEIDNECIAAIAEERREADADTSGE